MLPYDHAEQLPEENNQVWKRFVLYMCSTLDIKYSTCNKFTTVMYFVKAVAAGDTYWKLQDLD